MGGGDSDAGTDEQPGGEEGTSNGGVGSDAGDPSAKGVPTEPTAFAVITDCDPSTNQRLFASKNSISFSCTKGKVNVPSATSWQVDTRVYHLQKPVLGAGGATVLQRPPRVLNWTDTAANTRTCQQHPYNGLTMTGQNDDGILYTQTLCGNSNQANWGWLPHGTQKTLDIQPYLWGDRATKALSNGVALIGGAQDVSVGAKISVQGWRPSQTTTATQVAGAETPEECNDSRAVFLSDGTKIYLFARCGAQVSLFGADKTMGTFEKLASTAGDFQNGAVDAFSEGRVYGIVSVGGKAAAWSFPVAGGTPVKVVDVPTNFYPIDGNKDAFWGILSDASAKRSLVRVRVSAPGTTDEIVGGLTGSGYSVATDDKAAYWSEPASDGVRLFWVAK